MSKLNPGAFEFVPGRAFGLPKPAPPPPPPPIDRPEQSDPPRPAPTISLNIGAPNHTPPPPTDPVPPPHTRPTQPPSVSAAATPATSKPGTPAPSNKIFSTQKAKTDTNAVAEEVRAVADRAVLEDLYGNGTSLLHQSTDPTNPPRDFSKGASEHRLCWPC